MHQLTLGSLFDGLGGWQLAATRVGIRPIWSSEIEAFPLQITKKHFPQTLQLGDIRNLDGMNLPPVDIICAGSPCQDLSISGKKAGLAGERSGLFVKAIQIVREMQQATHGQFPRYFVWENVPGAFSSNQRKDFLAVLESIGGTKLPMPQSSRWAPAGLVRTQTCDIAWRVLNARYWGVPQSRNRIFLVADFGTHGRCAEQIFFESESVCGHPAEEHVLREAASTTSQSDARSTGTGCLNYFSQQRFGVYREDCASSCLAHRDYKGTRDLIVESQKNIVRRLTPLECERLQGLPDNWTKGGSDGDRYKAIGNGMAQPCADFILHQIAEAARLS